MFECISSSDSIGSNDEPDYSSTEAITKPVNSDYYTIDSSDAD